MRTICTSGYFNPLHRGHIDLFREAKKLGDRLVVIVNNDEQVKFKGSVPFMDEEERIIMVDAVRYVDEVILSVDTDRNICKTLELVKPDVFVKGGDSRVDNTPELELCAQIGIECLFNVGGEKTQSSSWLKDKAKQ